MIHSANPCSSTISSPAAHTLAISTIVDVCAAGLEIVEEQGFAEWITFYPAEFEFDEFPTGFDLVLHCDVAIFTRQMLQKLHRALKPGGRLVFVDLLTLEENQAPTARVEWTFLDSLRDPNFGFPTVEEFKSQLKNEGFGAADEAHVLSGGWVVLQAWKEG